MVQCSSTCMAGRRQCPCRTAAAPTALAVEAPGPAADQVPSSMPCPGGHLQPGHAAHRQHRRGHAPRPSSSAPGACTPQQTCCLHCSQTLWQAPSQHCTPARHGMCRMAWSGGSMLVRRPWQHASLAGCTVPAVLVKAGSVTAERRMCGMIMQSCSAEAVQTQQGMHMDMSWTAGSHLCVQLC